MKCPDCELIMPLKGVAREGTNIVRYVYECDCGAIVIIEGTYQKRRK